MRWPQERALALCASTCQANHEPAAEQHREANAYGPETTRNIGGDGGQRTLTSNRKVTARRKHHLEKGRPGKTKPQLPGTQQGFRYLEDEVQLSRYE